jgi:aspartate carbamoyltransferase catalytic subunit
MKHLLSIEDLEPAEIHEFLDLADSFAEVQQREIPKVPALRGKTVVMAFFQDSTRTRSSFDIASRRLSADVVNFSASTSSVNKGESLRDTIQTVSAMGIDAIVIRHSSSGVPQQITNWTDASVVNAGDGQHQHPTQALLDCLTIRNKLGDLQGKRILICGDLFQRVARSNILAFTKLGAEVLVCAPKTMRPIDIATWPVTIIENMDDVLADVDAVYLLRIFTKERNGVQLVPSLREYRTLYGLTAERAVRLNPKALIMHPGPMNRGIELDPEAADDPRSVVEDMVGAGVPVRMAVLFKLLSSVQVETVVDQGKAKG